MNQMQPHLRDRAETAAITGILRNLRTKQNDMKHPPKSEKNSAPASLFVERRLVERKNELQLCHDIAVDIFVISSGSPDFIEILMRRLSLGLSRRGRRIMRSAPLRQLALNPMSQLDQSLARHFSSRFNLTDVIFGNFQ